MFSRWISLSGLFRGTRIGRRRSFSVTSAARQIRPSAYPVRIPARVFMLQGTMIIAATGKDPDAIDAPWSFHE